MLLKVLFGICILIEAIFTPWYLKALWPQKCFKSLCLKMVCSAMFFLVGVLSLFIAGNTSQYAITIMIALLLGWIGDYFLHAKPSNTYFVIGFVSFMIGHVVYIVAYVNALPKLIKNYNQFDPCEVIFIAAFLIVAVIIGILMKMKFNPKAIKYAAILYAAILIVMFTKASSLGIRYYLSGAENGLYAMLVLGVGSLFFLMSDASLAVILFAGKNKNYPLKIFNIVTYFWGQVLLASSILFINI